MADVFVSYSRRDTAYVKRLVEALQERGKDVWVDTEGIRDAEVFPAALRRAVEGSDAFVFVISPDSVQSPFCEQEVDRAVELNKRVVPLALRPVPDEEIPDEIRYRNWISAGDDAELGPTLERLIKALDTDLEWEHEHTRLTVKALEWERAGGDRSFLLRGSELAAGEQWLAAGAGKDRGSTQLERDYLLASRAAATRRQRAVVGASLGVAVVSIALLVFALISRGNAISARNTAKAQALAADSQAQLAIDPERSVLLATAAVHEKTTPDSLFAMRSALDASPIRFRLPDAGPQTCAPNSFASTGVAFSPDGRRLAEGLCNGTVVFADAHNGRVVRRVRVGATAGPLSYNRTGTLLAASVGPHTMLVDPATGAVRDGAPSTMGQAKSAFNPASPDELAIADTSHVLLWNVRTHRARQIDYGSAQNGPPPSGVAFSRDGRRLAISLTGNSAPGQPALIVIDVASGRRLATSTTATEATAFSRDGRTLVAAQMRFSPGEGRIAELDARTLKLRRTLQQLPDVQATAVAVSPDGTRAVYGAADGTAGLLSLETGRSIESFVGQTAAVPGAAFSPDGRLAATASQDGTLRVWRATGQELSTTRVGASVEGLRPARNGFVVLGLPAGVRDGIFVQEFTDGRRAKPPLEISPTENTDADFISDDGSLAGIVPLPHGATPTAPVQLWSVPQRRVIRTLPPATVPTGAQPAFSPDKEWIAMGLPAGAPTTPGTQGRLPPVGAPLVIRNTRTGRMRAIGTTSCGNGWRSWPFSRDGKLLAGGTFCGQVSVWKLAGGKQVGHTFSIGGELADVAFSPDGSRLAAASWNSTITVADARTGRVISVLTDHTKGVPDVGFSPDGRYLASASLDATLRIWDARSLNLLRVMRSPAPLTGAVFTPDSRDVFGFDNQDVREWDACTACGDAKALLRIARTRVTRRLTPQERRTFGAP